VDDFQIRGAVTARLYEGVKKCSMFNVQLSVVIGGGASRYLFLKMPRRRRIRKWQLTIER
jgi:hypothetical protein